MLELWSETSVLRNLLCDGTSEMLLSVLLSKPQFWMLNHQKYSDIDVTEQLKTWLSRSSRFFMVSVWPYNEFRVFHKPRIDCSVDSFVFQS